MLLNSHNKTFIMTTVGFKIDDYFIWAINQEQAIEHYLSMKKAKNEIPNMFLINQIRDSIKKENVNEKRIEHFDFKFNLLRWLSFKISHNTF